MAHKITLRRSDEEHLTILVDGAEVGSYSHDSDGWHGIEAAEALATRIAGKLGIEVEEAEGHD